MQAVENVVVFGLRCSGTNYIAELIKKNYPDIQVSEGSYGVWKHMWQAETHFSVDKILMMARQKTVYLFVARNVFEWLQSFNRQPHHCPWARKMSLENLLDSSPFQSFNNGMLLESYPSILDERKAKHSHIVNRVLPRLPNARLIKYEDVRDNPSIIKDVLQPFGILRDAPIDNVEYYKKEQGNAYIPKQYPEISSETRDLIIQNVDWETEAKWGYEIPTLSQ
jgi:hypothetical protein